MKQQKYLFVCRKGIDRSVTAYNVSKTLEEFFGHKKTSGFMGIEDGIIEGDMRENAKETARTYDLVFVMENWMVRTMQVRYKVKKEKIKCLNIPAMYSQNDYKLRLLLEENLMEYFIK